MADKKPVEPKKLTAKQQAKADALVAKLGLSGDVKDVSLIKIASKQADQRAKDLKAYLAIITPKRRKVGRPAK